MNKIARSEIIETKEKRTIILDEQTEMDLWTIERKIKEISEKSLTEEQGREFTLCLIQHFFFYKDNIAELEDTIWKIAELLTMFIDTLKGGGQSEE